MKRRRLLTAAPALALGLAGCTGSPATPSGPVAICFGTYEDMVERYEAYAEAFTTANPNITVTVVPVTPPSGSSSADYEERLAGQAEFARAFAGAADTFSYFQSDVNSSGYVLDLAPLVHDLDEDDFYPGVLAAFRSDDRLWAIPQHVNLGCMVTYDRTILSEADVAVPQADWTRDDLRLLAQALTVTDGDRTSRYGYLNGSDSSALVSLAAEAGGRLDAPAVLDAAAQYAEMVLTDKSTYWRDWYNDTTAWQEYQRLIYYDRVAMWCTEVYSYGLWREVGRDLGLLQLPQARASGVPWGVGVSAATRHPDECLLWADFLSRQQPLSGMLPARRSVAEDWQLRVPVEDEDATRVALQAMEQATYLSNADYLAVPHASAALAAIVEEGVPVESALAEAQSGWEQAVVAMATYPTPTAAPISMPTIAADE